MGATAVSATDPDPGGDKFVDWYVSYVTSGTSASLRLTAYWEQAYHVTYNLNGGSGTVPLDDNLYLNTESVTLNNGSGLSWSGHKFLGWAITSDAEEALTSYEMDPDSTTLYAVWANTYTVSYDGNGSEGGSVPVDSAATLPAIR